MLLRFNPETQIIEVLRGGEWLALPEAEGPGDYQCYRSDAAD